MPSAALLPLFAFWPFASGAMLLWGLAALVPIVIHLWNRRRYREVSWAAMEYLLAAMRKHSRRILIEQWIVLAVRTLILLLFAIALAQPLLSYLPALAGGASGQTHWVLVVDVSYSMAAQREGKTRLEIAKGLAASLVERSTQGDGFTLVTLGDAPQAIIRTPAFDPKDVLEELDALRVQHGGARLASGLAEVESLVAAARDKHRRMTETRICILSDLGRTTWDEATTDAVRQRLTRLAEKNTLVLMDVGDEQLTNVAVTSLTAREAVLALNRDTTFEIEVQNFGREALPATSVEVWIDGRRTHAHNVELRAGGKASVAVTHRFEVPGEHRVEARLPSDLLEVDNHRFASAPVREALHVLCVQGTPNEARHLAIALEPTRSERPLVVPTLASESALLERDLTEFDAVVLANVGRFSRNEASVLRRYVQQGGGLIVFLGDQAQVENYNEQLASGNDWLLPASLEGLAQTSQYRLNPLAYRHPIVAAFAGHERAGLLTTPVWKYVRLKPRTDDGAQAALGFDNGDPAIVTAPRGRGRVVLVATAASTSSVDRTTNPPTPWTALSTWPSFPPLVQEALAYSVSGAMAQRNLQVGDDLSGVLPGASSQVAVQMVTPDGRSERISPKREGDDAQWSYGETRFSGIYEAQIGSPINQSRLYAVNLATRESDLERIDRDALPPELLREAPTSGTAALALSGGTGRHLYRFFLGGVLVLLLVETVLAWRIGSGAR